MNGRAKKLAGRKIDGKFSGPEMAEIFWLQLLTKTRQGDLKELERLIRKALGI
jgi:hypothetical protein